jgi:hypothetical protein
MKKLIIMLFMLCIIPNVLSLTYYVNSSSASCSDFNDRNNATAATPMCTFKAGLTNLTSGDIMYVSGNHNDYSNGYTISNQVFTDMTYILAYPGNNPIISTYNTGYNNTSNGKWTNLTASTGVVGLWVSNISSTSLDYITVFDTRNNGSYYIYSTYNNLINTSNPIGTYFNTTNNVSVYLKLNSTDNPNNISLYLNKQANMLIISNVTNLTITGLTFLGGNGAIDTYSTRSQIDLHFINNTFIGQGTDETLTIQNNTRTNITGNTFRVNRLGNWSWELVKSSLMEQSAILVTNANDGIIINNNNISGYFNGIFI